jgi:hypothetical protein
MTSEKSNPIKSFNLFPRGELSISDSILIDQLEPQVLDEYNHFTDELILNNQLKGISLLLNSTCRNSLAFPLLDLFCKISLLEEKLKKSDEIEVIYVDSYELAAIASELLQRYEREIDVKILSNKKNLFLFVLFNFVKSTYLATVYWIWSRLMRLKKVPKGKIRFIDNFILIDSFKSDGSFFDRYYTGHEKYFSDDEKKLKWFAPTLVGINYPRQMIKIGRSIQSTNDNFLIQEAWLKITDYIFSIFWSFFIPFRIKNVPRYKGLSLNKYLLKENYKDIGSPSLMLAISKYRFIRRLSKEKVEISVAIDWNENQIIDRAINLGFRDYYKNLTVHGYQGFVLPSYYACVQPTCLEYKLGTLPHIIHVPGKAGNALKQSVCPEIPVKISPAFRFSHVFQSKDLSSKELPIILVALPMMLNESINIIKSVMHIQDSLNINTKLMIKPHPSCNLEDIFNRLPESKDIEFTNKSMKNLLEISSLMISSTSSSCVEAVAVGLPVAIYGNNYGVTLNPIPDFITGEIWKVFYTGAQLIQFVNNALKQDQRNPNVSELFQPVTKDGVRDLFTLT